MKNIKWKVSLKGKYIDSGTVQAESDKEALGMVLLDFAEGRDLKDDDCYSVTAGEFMTTSFGDEFERSARVSAHGMDENTPMDAPHHFQPKPSDVGIVTDPDGEHIKPGDIAKAAKRFMDRTPVDTGAARDSWGPTPNETTRKKLARERMAGRRVFHPNEAEKLVKEMTGRDIYCGNNPVWTQRELDSLIGKLRCPASPVGPNGHHDWASIHGTIGVHGCVGLGLERCPKCGTGRVKRMDPPGMNEKKVVQTSTGRSRQRNQPNIPIRTAKGEALRKAFSFDPHRDAAGAAAAAIMDKHVKMVSLERMKFAQANNVPVEDVVVEFIHDEVHFSLKD